jgi:hypothetical protein
MMSFAEVKCVAVCSGGEIRKNRSVQRGVLLAALVYLLVPFSVSVSQDAATYVLQAEEFLSAPDSIHATTFNNLVSFCIDVAGNIVIPDLDNSRIVVFSAEGRFIKQVSCKGDDHGTSYRSYFAVNTSSDGFAYAIEPIISKGFMVYDRAWNLIRRSDYAKEAFGIWEFAFAAEHEVAAQIQEMNRTADRGIVRTTYMALVNLGDFTKTQLTNPVEKEGMDYSSDYTNIVSDKRERFYFGRVSRVEYIVYSYDSRGKLLKEIRRDFKPTAMTGANKKEEEKRIADAERLFGLKEAKENGANGKGPFYEIIRRLAIDSYDNLWVFTCEKQNDDMLSVDLFDSDGNFGKTFFLDNKELGSQSRLKVLVQNGFLYSIVPRSGERDERVFRYKLPKAIMQ